MIKPDTLDAISRYVEDGLPPGGFLLAVLQNDLFRAVAHADVDNLHALPEIVAYIWNEIPHRSWGSKEAVRSWIESKRGVPS